MVVASFLKNTRNERVQYSFSWYLINKLLFKLLLVLLIINSFKFVADNGDIKDTFMLHFCYQQPVNKQQALGCWIDK